MATKVEFSGIDYVAIMQAASAEPQGQQKLKYCQLVADAVGSNPIVDILVDGVKYRSTVNTGKLSASSSGILLPTQFVEPPTTNVSTALTGTNVKLRFTNATNSSVWVEVPIRVGNGDGYLDISESLSGTEAVRTLNARFLAPLTLDGGGSGSDPGDASGIYLADTLQDDMTLANENGWGLELAPNTQRGSTVYAQITTAILRADGNSGYPDKYLSDNIQSTPTGNITITDNSSVRLLCWCVWGRASGATTPRAKNTRLQIRNNRLYAKSRSNVWSLLSEDLGDAITGASWHANFAYPGNEDYDEIETGNLLYQIRQEPTANGGASSLGSIGYGGWGTNTARDGSTLKKFEHYTLHNYPIEYTNTRAWWVTNVKEFVQICEARLIVHDPTQPDDRADANWMCWIGADWYIDGKYIMDGAGVGRLKLVDNNWGIFAWGIYDTDDILTNPPPGFS